MNIHQLNVKYGQEPILSLELHRPTDESHPYERSRVHVYMCVLMYLYIYGCRCVYVFIWSGPPGYENMRQRLRWFPKSPTHQVAPQQTNKNSWISMFKGVEGEREKKDRGCHNLWKRKIPQCELTKSKAGNRLTIVSVSWFTPLCRSQQFSPVSIALNNSQQFPNLRFPTIFANLRFSSPQIGAQASRHGKQEHFDPH